MKMAPESFTPAVSKITEDTAILIQARGLSKVMQGELLLEGVNFTIHAGEIITLIGPNGCGKTTLLRCLLGLDSVGRGEISRKVNLRVGYVPQKIAFQPTLPITVRDFLKLMAPKPIFLRQTIEMIGIQGLMNKQMNQLSGGETQRVLLAQALLDDPELLVLDEPVQGVDFSGQAELYQLIRKLSRERQFAVLMVSHDLHLVMADTDKVLCLNKHICCSGTPQRVSRDPAFVKLFGEDVARQIALYVHHHDHHHDLEGNIVSQNNSANGHSC